MVEAAGEHGWRVDPEDAQSFAAAITNALASVANKDASRAQVSRYSWERVTEQYDSLYEWIVNSA